MIQPYSKSCGSKGAGVATIHIAPEGDAITDCNTLRTAEEKEKETESGHDTQSRSGWGGGGLSPTPFDKTNLLERVCGQRADDSQFVCCCENYFSDSSGITRARAFYKEALA